MRYNRQETMEILEEYSPAVNVDGPEKWIDFHGFLVPLNHFYAVLRVSGDQQDFLIFQGPQGLAVRIGNLKIYFSHFKKVMPERTDLNFFYLAGRPYDIFSGLPFDFDQDDLTSLRRFFIKNYGKSPKYREINNVV